MLCTRTRACATYNKKTPSAEETLGHVLWGLFRCVVRLTENMRASRDAVFADFLKHVRRGEYRAVDKRLLSHELVVNRGAGANVLPPAAADAAALAREAPPPPLPLAGYTPLVVTGNLFRHMLNWRAARGRADRMPVFALPARFSATRRGVAPTPHDLQRLFSLPELERLSPLLPLWKGMPVMVTHNVAIPLGVANGTLGEVVEVRFPPRTAFGECVKRDPRRHGASRQQAGRGGLCARAWRALPTAGVRARVPA